ncbi:hypothetical protein CC80DRAFT_595490 [Byssothecium circinans]|uniref:Uncharacterized protein n=1 Tax=Byssothecium circinans TaxID=147558 RepID=A0A6A5TTB4_9PLEO|nr:hypothetical protein CC80DRAFT_595490 [Byssothecium circinans]
MAAIPLLCTICPKRPKFSDVSHLLTHIASKGHLSHYYKEKVRASNDDASRRLIDAYDRWYTEWNVEELMSDRMSQKDKRRARTTRPAVRATPAPRIEAPVPRHARSRGGTLLDPRLSEQQAIKVEYATMPTPTPQPGPVLRHRGFAPRMQYWPTESRASSRTGSYTNPDYDTSSEYSDPSERRRYRYPIDNSYAVEDEPADIAVADPMAVSESTKLKGVYWPGMDIFDSATPEMRRKRNQKKDSSVVQQLELNSQEVEALELIFTPQGSFKRQRRISSSVYDDDEEDSPIKLESPKQTLSRSILADMDSNALRRPRQLTRTQFPYLSRNSYEDEHRGLDFGYGHGHGARAPKRKRAFDVFQDEEIFSQPAGFNYLTASLNQHASPTPAPTLPSYKTFGSPLQFDNKENTLPALQQPSYDTRHPLQPIGYHYHAYAYGLGQDQNAFTYNNALYAHSAYQQQGAEDDDQRTVTAPPSPSTG